MKIKLKQQKIITNDNIPNKQLNITILFKDRFSLMTIFHSIAKSVHLGTEYKTEEINNNFYEYEMKFSKKYNYQEMIIDGKVCHVYTSKL